MSYEDNGFGLAPFTGRPAAGRAGADRGGDAGVSERKDRLIQTRVPEKLESTLKQAALKRRTTVSQMIRNILEDTFDLVDGVVASVDAIVSDSVELAQQVGRDVRRIGEAKARTRPPCRAPLADAGSAARRRPRLAGRGAESTACVRALWRSSCRAEATPIEASATIPPLRSRSSAQRA